jgi:hypothetical protein
MRKVLAAVPEDEAEEPEKVLDAAEVRMAKEAA